MEGARRRLGRSPPVVQSSLEQKSAIIRYSCHAAASDYKWKLYVFRSKRAVPLAFIWSLMTVLLALDVFIVGLLLDCWLFAWIRADVLFVLECIALMLAMLNTIAAVSTALWPALLAHPLLLTAQQMRLLAVDTTGTKEIFHSECCAFVRQNAAGESRSIIINLFKIVLMASYVTERYAMQLLYEIVFMPRPSRARHFRTRHTE